ncbi:MAG TPA: SRPBCC family protein [Anaerolineales bacterium]
MIKVKGSILINAPVEKVFAFMDDPCNLPEIWPSMIETHAKGPSSAGGQDFEWEYKMAGLRIKGESEVVERIPNRKMITKSKKGIETTFVWDYVSEAGGTRLTVEAEYNIPVPLVGRLAESVIVKQNEYEANMLLENLKTRMEG